MCLIGYLKAEFAQRERLDMSRLVMWGHSYGGASVASVACSEKNLVKGVAILDGW